MQFEEPIRQGEFLKRYKRFFADVRLNGEVIVAHVPNTGSLKTCLFENCAAVWTESSNPARKLKATLQFLQTPSGWVGVNTSLTNDLVFEAWQEKVVPDWANFAAAKREFKISKESRIDLVLAPTDADLEARKNLTYIEVKNVSLAENGVARFPDAVTERGQKHLRDLMALKASGANAEIVFVIQRQGCMSFTPADDIDPEYGRLLREAVKSGVEARAFICDIDPHIGVTINPAQLPILL